MGKREKQVEVMQGTLDMLILQTLQWGPHHGYGISESIRLRSDELLDVETGSLYPALHRLERQGWISSSWKTSEHNQRVRQYRLTAGGRKQLLRERSHWEALAAAIAGVLDPAKGR